MSGTITTVSGGLPALPEAQDPGRNPALAYLLSLNSQRSRQTMRSFLAIVADILGAESIINCPWHELRRQHVQAIVQKLQDRGLAPSTINTYLSAIKGVAMEAWSMGLLDGDSYQRLKAVRSVRGSRLARGRALDRGETQQLLAVCLQDGTPKGVRDAAMLAILLGAGLRRAELVALNYESVDWREESIVVLGKGNKERLVYLPERAVQLLRCWVEEVRWDGPGPLFVRIRRYGDVTDKRLSDQAVYYVLTQRRIEAGIEHCAPHDLRRTYASELLDADVDMKTVQDLLGHADITTTQRYDRRGNERLKKASKKVRI